MGLCCLLDTAGHLALALVGVRVAMAVYRIIFPYFIARPLGLAHKLQHHLASGEWAVVTGATDGIGKAYAAELAKSGANLVLVGRNPAKLQDVKDAILAQSKVEIRLVTFDFANSSHKNYSSIADALKGLDVGALVNCVGISYTDLGRVGLVPNGEQLAADLLSVNCLSATLMSRIVVEGMVKRGRGAIINVASFSGCYPTAFLSIYAASKAYVSFLSDSMRSEYEGTGVEIQPMFVATKMSTMKPSFTCPTPEAYAQSAIATFGHQSTTFGCFSHSLQGEIMALLPKCVVVHFIKNAMTGLKAKQERRKAKAQ